MCLYMQREVGSPEETFPTREALERMYLEMFVK